MSAGISGSNFWLPIFVLGFGLGPRVAFLLALSTMAFGFGAGVIRNWRAGQIDGALLRRLAIWALPAAAVGSVLSGRVDPEPLLIAFAVFAVGQGAWLVLAGDEVTAPSPGRLKGLAALGGLSQGLIATGSGGLLGPSILASRREGEHATGVGTTVAVVFAASVVAAALRLDAPMRATVLESGPQLSGMFIFLVPGAIAGGQLGPRLAARLPRRALRRWAGAVLFCVGALVAARALA